MPMIRNDEMAEDASHGYAQHNTAQENFGQNGGAFGGQKQQAWYTRQTEMAEPVTSNASQVNGAASSAGYEASGEFNESNLNGRESIMKVPASNKLQEIKERCFARLNTERQNLIRKRREMSGYGTHTPAKQRELNGKSSAARGSGVFDMPTNTEGLVSKMTKVVAEQVDQELLDDQAILASIIDEEKEQLPELTVDQWNEIYLEVQEDLSRLLAQQLIEDRRQDPEADYELNQMFSEMAIEQQAEILDPENNDSCVCAMCKSNVARRVHGSRVVCELQGCLDINVRFQDFRVEDLMIKLCQLIDEHKSFSKENDCGCFDVQDVHRKINYQIVLMDDNFQFETLIPEMEVTDRQSIVLFMQCDSCNFLDFMNIFS